MRTIEEIQERYQEERCQLADTDLKGYLASISMAWCDALAWVLGRDD